MIELTNKELDMVVRAASGAPCAFCDLDGKACTNLATCEDFRKWKHFVTLEELPLHLIELADKYAEIDNLKYQITVNEREIKRLQRVITNYKARVEAKTAEIMTQIHIIDEEDNTE